MYFSTKGVYYGQYRNELDVYSGIDFSKKAFLFSGQNSSRRGMFKNFYLSSKLAKSRFALADQIFKDTINKSFTDYILNENRQNDSTPLVYRNIALYLAQVSLFEELVSKNIIPSLVTGHSFGEYAALTSAGILSIEDGLKIIYARDSSSIDKKIGRMFAVNIDYGKLLDIKSKANFNFYISNVNSSKQCVVSVTEDLTVQFVKLFKSEKIASIQLDVSLPYHCELLKSVANNFLKNIDLDAINFKKPNIPFLSSVNNEILDKNNYSNNIIKEIIRSQLLEPVRFDIQMTKMREKNINNYIEIGPDKVLSTFILNSGSDLPFKTNFATDYFLTTEDKHFKAVTSEKSSGFFTKILNKAIMTVTGYEVTSIDVADRLQEDLGIDSIKKAEIIFKVLDEVGIKNNTTSQNIRVSDLSTINDLLHYFDYQKRTYLQSDMNVESLQNREFVNANEIYIKKENGHLVKSCMRLFEVFEFNIDCNKQSENLKQDLFRFVFDTSEKNKIVHILINEENFLNEISNEADINLPLNYLEKIVKYFSSFRLSNAVYGKDIHFQFILDTDNCPEMIILRSFLKTWALEQSIVGSQIIEISKNSYDKLKSKIIHDSLDPAHSYIKYIGADRYVSDLVLQETRPLSVGYNMNNKVYLLIGGFSGIGLEILEKIKLSSQSTIYVIGRSSIEKNSISENLIRFKNENIQIQYRQCDARDIVALNALIDDIICNHGTLDLIVNCAGVVISKKLDNRTLLESNEELSVKVKVATNLAYIAEKGQIKQVINFSSIIGYFPNIGQAVYSLANSYIDYLSTKVDKRGYRFQSVRWPAWDDTGVTKAGDNKKYVDLLGMSKLKTHVGLDYFFDTIISKETVTTVLDENTKLKCQNNNLNSLAYSQLISQYQSPLYNDNLILGGLNLDNLPYLKDHLLTGKPILASSNMIAIYMQIGFSIWGEIPSIKKFHGHNFIFIEQKDSSVLLELNRDAESIQMKMKTTYVHSEAQIFKNRSLKPIVKKIPNYRARLNPEKLRTKVIETVGDFEYTKLFFVDPTTKDVVMQVPKINLSKSTKMPLFDLIFNLVEISHQVIGTKGQWLTGRYSVPQSISELDFFENTEITDDIYSFCESFVVDGKHSMANSFLVNNRGEVILKILNNRFAEINVDADLKNRFEVLTSNQVATDNNL